MLDFFRKKGTLTESSLLNDSRVELHSGPIADPVKKIMANLDISCDDRKKYVSGLLSSIAREKEILHGMFLIYDGKSSLNYLSGYACINENVETLTFEIGEGLPGQVAYDRKPINLKDVPDGYIVVQTGLGQASPNSLLIFPVCHNNTLHGVIELSSFQNFTPEDESFFLELSEQVGKQMSQFSNLSSTQNG
jgi:putative methionine-R-sulfoxide reductase with GAF domain